MMTERQKTMFLATCRHFRGIQHKHCAAGLVMADAPRPLPCLPGVRPEEHCPTSCAKFQSRTVEDYEERERVVAEALGRFGRLTDEGKCHTCEAKVDDTKQVGHCVYLQPCGHRFGQADEGPVRRSLGLPERAR